MWDFEASLAGQHLIISAQYLEAALVLSKAQQAQGNNVLFRPTLALAGQGLELMLKSCMHWNEVSPPTRGGKGHAIKDFWKHDVCEPIRGHMFSNAEFVKDEAIRAGLTPSDGLREGDLATLITEYVLVLAELHGEQPYPLRYPTKEQKLAPRTPWLVGVLRRTANDFLKRPEQFKLNYFRGLQMARQEN